MTQLHIMLDGNAQHAERSTLIALHACQTHLWPLYIFEQVKVVLVLAHAGRLLHAVACHCIDYIHAFFGIVLQVFAPCYMHLGWRVNLPTEVAGIEVLCCRALLEADDSATEPCMPPALIRAPSRFASSPSAATGALLSAPLGSSS